MVANRPYVTVVCVYGRSYRPTNASIFALHTVHPSSWFPPCSSLRGGSVRRRVFIGSSNWLQNWLLPYGELGALIGVPLARRWLALRGSSRRWSASQWLLLALGMALPWGRNLITYSQYVDIWIRSQSVANRDLGGASATITNDQIKDCPPQGSTTWLKSFHAAGDEKYSQISKFEVVRSISARLDPNSWRMVGLKYSLVYSFIMLLSH